MRFLPLCLFVLLCACSALPPAPPQPEKAATPEARQAEEAAAEAREAARPSRMCGPDKGKAYTYRKKIAVLAMPPQHSHEAVDLPGVQIEWSRELQRRLRDSDRFLVIDGSDYRLDDTREPVEQIASLARHFNVQFIVAGRITSLATQMSKVELGPLVPLRTSFSDSRVIESELDIFDGQTGLRVARNQHGVVVSGPASVNRDALPMEGEFYRTPLGLAIKNILDRQSEATLDELACLPFVARVVGKNGEGVRIDAGAASNVQTGDRLQLLQPQNVHIAGGGGSSWVDKPYGELIIQQVFPDAAVGVPAQPANQPDWRYGGIVRAW